MWRLGFIVLVLGVLLAPPVSAVELSDDDRALVARIEHYLNRVTTFEARFVQLADGRMAQGRIYMSRPGRMRIDYDPPVPVFMVAKEVWVMYHDRELQQTSYIPASQTPLSLLLSEDISLDDNAEITGFERDGNTIFVSLVMRELPDAGSLTIIMQDNPLRLVKWRVVDAQGISVEVALLDPRFGVVLDDDLFSLIDPALASPE